MVVDGCRAIGAGVLQGQEDHAGAHVRRHQATDLARTLDILAYLLKARGRTVVIVGNHWAAVEAVFGDADPACGWGPQRLHVGAIDAAQQEQFVVELLEGFQILRGVDGALVYPECDSQGVATLSKLGAVLEVVLDVGVIHRDHLLERRAQAQVCCLVGEQAAEQ
ncbi:hypothetical protein D9M68_494550 [compost metagenome]